MESAVEESHRVELKISFHATSIEGVRNAVNLGADGIEHAYFLDKQAMKVEKDKCLVEKLAEKQIYVCQTLPVLEASLDEIKKNPREDWTDFDVSEYHRLTDFQEKLMEIFEFQNSAGVNTVAGNDAGWRFCKFGTLYKGLEMMHRGGMSNIEVIHAATSKPAKYLGLGKKIGLIKIGYQADLLILNKDPGDDKSNFSDVHSVYKKGEIVKNILA